MKKIDKALNNYINGNKSDFISFVRGTSKGNLIALICCAPDYNIKTENILKYLNVIFNK